MIPANITKEALNKSNPRHAGENRHPVTAKKSLDSSFRRNDKTFVALLNQSFPKLLIQIFPTNSIGIWKQWG
jgi:hypothetical protein